MTKATGKTTKGKAYEAPSLTTVAFQMEQGFNVSTLYLFQPPAEESSDPQQVEDFNSRGDWTSGSDNFWN